MPHSTPQVTRHFGEENSILRLFHKLDQAFGGSTNTSYEYYGD